MENIKIPFFKRVWRAVTKFERYIDFAAEKPSVAVKYFAKLIIIFALIVAVAFAFKFNSIIHDDEQVQIMLNQLADAGTDTTQFAQGIEMLRSNNSTNIYLTIGFTFFVYVFIYYFLYGLLDALLVSFVGWITTKAVRIKMRYKSIFSMSIYALTLSTILNMIYITVNTLTGFTINYFQVAYNVIAYIYIATAILIIRSDFIEQQQELIKIVKEQAVVRKEHEKENEEEPDKEDKDKGKDEPEPEPEIDPVENKGEDPI